jgi:hypothetical protein
MKLENDTIKARTVKLLDDIESLRNQLLVELTRPLKENESSVDKTKHMRTIKNALNEKIMCWDLIKRANIKDTMRD